MKISSPDIMFRKLEQKDVETVCELLEQLSHFPDGVENIDTKKAWAAQSSYDNIYSVVGIIDTKICCYASVMIEYKIRGGISGHIEDVVVDHNVRKQGYGLKLLQHLIDYCKEKGCYKVILDCFQETAPFYEQLGFKTTHLGMSMLL